MTPSIALGVRQESASYPSRLMAWGSGGLNKINSFLLLGLVLAGAYILHEGGYLYAVGAVGTNQGWRFAFSLAVVFMTAAAGAALPRWRLRLVFALSVLHLFVIHRPLRATVALGVWTGFYVLTQLRLSWWSKSIPMIALYASPFILLALDPTSALNGALMVAFCVTNFALRSVLYAYEATLKRDELASAGLMGYLLCLVLTPLTLVNFAPIGFIVLLRGFKQELDARMMRRGVMEIALGVVFLTAFQIGHMTRVLPTYHQVALAAESLNTLTALAASHLLLLKFFLKVAGDVHLVVGMLRVFGFDIPSGTDRPLLSRNILEFWRRWNTYYRDYLLTLGYYPVAAALKRRPMLAVAAGGAAAFVLSGLAHVVQYMMRHPEKVTLRLFLEGHVWGVLFGAFAIVWMVRELRRKRQARPREREEEARGAWQSLRRLGAIAVTLSVASLILLTYYPPLVELPLSTSVGIFKALLRLPGPLLP